MRFPFGPRRGGTLHNAFPPGGRYGRGGLLLPKQMKSEIPKDDEKDKDTEQKQAE